MRSVLGSVRWPSSLHLFFICPLPLLIGSISLQRHPSEWLSGISRPQAAVSSPPGPHPFPASSSVSPTPSLLNPASIAGHQSLSAS